MNLSNNMLSGSLPLAYGSAPRLSRLYLHNNDLSGPVGSWVGYLLLQGAGYQPNCCSI